MCIKKQSNIWNLKGPIGWELTIKLKTPKNTFIVKAENSKNDNKQRLKKSETKQRDKRDVGLVLLQRVREEGRCWPVRVRRSIWNLRVFFSRSFCTKYHLIIYNFYFIPLQNYIVFVIKIIYYIIRMCDRQDLLSFS